MGPNNADKPYVWLKIEAIGTFEDPENIKILTPKLFDFFSSELNIEKVSSFHIPHLDCKVFTQGLDSHEFLQAVSNSYWEEWENSGSAQGLKP